MAAMVVLWSCDLYDLNGDIEGATCRIGDDNFGYLAFHCGGNFNIGCNAYTTIVNICKLNNTLRSLTVNSGYHIPYVFCRDTPSVDLDQLCILVRR